MAVHEQSHDDDPVRIPAYDPAGVRSSRLSVLPRTSASGPWVTGRGFHRVASTSVPGLPAKPVIDIMAGVESLDRSRPCIEKVASLNYLYPPYLGDEMHCFCKPPRLCMRGESGGWGPERAPELVKHRDILPCVRMFFPGRHAERR